MTLGDLENKLKNFDLKSIFENLKGQTIPISDDQNCKVLNAEMYEDGHNKIQFERELTDKEYEYFKKWLNTYLHDKFK